MPLTKPSLASALLLAMAAPAVAQSVDDELGVATLQDFSGGGMLNGTYFDVRNQSNSGVGYQHGFTQLGAFAPLLNDGQYLIAPQARLIITDTSKIGVNLGLVGRVYDAGRDRIWGANLFYDNDETTYENRYSQIGFGFESLGQFLDVRANAYLPTGSSDKVIGPNGLSPNLFYTGNQLNFTGSFLSEESLRGADFELGVPVSQNMTWLRAYGGGYFYDATQNSVSGVRGRLDAQLATDLTAGVIATHDSTFKTRVNAYVEWRFSGFQPSVWFPRQSTQDRMLTSVQRNWRVSTTTYSSTVAVPIINPRDNEAYFITWVDSANPNGGTGTGTYEDPLTQLPASSPPADLILVRQGNSDVTPYNNSITLTDFQRLLGEGKIHQIEGYANYGPFVIPQQTFTLPEFDFNDPSRYPTLTSTGGSVVTLANNNEVSAFNIQDALGSGITNTPGGSTNFLLQNLNITGNNTAGSATAGGIYLSNVDGTGIVRTVDTSNNLGFGTRIAADTDLDLLLDGLTSTGNELDNLNVSGASGADIDVTLATTSGANAFTGSTAGSGIVMSIDNATGTFTSASPIVASGNFLDGVRLESNSGILGTTVAPVLLSGADLSNNGRDALSLVATGAGANISVAGTGINGSSAGRNGLNIETDALANVTASLTNSNLSSAGVNAVFAEALGDSTQSIVLSNVNSSLAGEDGLSLNAQTGGSIVASMTGGSLGDAGQSAIGFAAANIFTNDGTVALTMTDVNANADFNSDLATNQTTGLEITTTNANDVVTATLSNVLMSGNLGSGVDIDATGGSVTTSLTNVTSQNNGTSGYAAVVDNAQLISTISGGSYSGSTTASGFDLDLSNSPGGAPSSFTATNTEFGGSGASGGLVALDAADLTMTLTGVDLSNNVDDALNLALINGSTLTANLTDVVGDAGVAQQRGLVYTVASASSLNLTDLRGSYDGNALGAIVGSTTGAGTTATTSFTNTTGTQTLADAVTLSSSDSATHTASFLNGNFALATGNGFNVTSATAATMNLFLDNVTTDGAGANGMLADASGGSTLNVGIENSFLTGSTLTGLTIDVTDANTVATFGANNTQFNGNGSEGLLAAATTGGELNFRSLGSQFNGNGLTVPSDGVNVTADGAGTIVRTLFADSQANGNTGDGFDFTVSNDAYMANRIDTSTATGNAGYGVQMNATGASSTALLLMEGDNDISGNTLGQYNATFTGIDTAIVSLSGSFNNGPADGVNINMTGTGTGTGIIAIQGDVGQTIDGNAGNGIALTMADLDNAGIIVSGYDSISNNGLDGINIDLSNIGIASVELSGPTTLENNGDQAIDIVLNTVGLGTLPPAVTGGTYSVLTRTDNLPLDPVLPAPVDLTLAALGVAPTADGIVVDGMVGRGSSPDTANSAGMVLSGTNVTNASGTGGIVFNAVASSGTVNGDGLQINLTGSTLDLIQVTNSEFSSNTGNGILSDGNGLVVNLDNTTLNTLDISDNIGTPLAGGTYAFDFFTSNLAWRIDNDSDAGKQIVGVTIDISPTGYTFDTEEPGGFFSRPFQPSLNSDVTTGLTTVNGTPIVAGTNPLQDANTLLPAAGGGIPDLSQLIDLAFNDFDTTETFSWSLMATETPNGTFVFGSDLAGSPVTVTFADGRVLSTNIVDTGFGTATVSQSFANVLAGMSGNDGAGVIVNANNGTTITNTNIENNLIDANGTHGVDLQIAASELTNPVNVSGNTITGSVAGNGFNYNNQDTSNDALTLNFTGNQITGNNGTALNGGGNGISIVQNNAAETVTLNLVNNDISGNDRSGVLVDMGGNTTANVNVTSDDAQIDNPTAGGSGNTISTNGFGGIVVLADNNSTANSPTINLNIGGTGTGANVFNGNADAGVALDLQDASIANVDVTNATFSGTTIGGGSLVFNGEGFAARLNDTATMNGANFTGAGTPSNLQFTGNASHGLSIFNTGSSTVNGLTVDNVLFANNTGDGVNILREGNGNLVGTQIVNSTFTNNADAIDITARSGLVVDTYTIADNTIDQNRGNGILLRTDFDAQMIADITDNTITDNGQNGIQTVQQINDITDARELDGLWTGNTITGNAANGVSIGTDGDILLGTLANPNLIADNGQNGLRISGTGIVVATGNTITGNGATAGADEGNGVNINTPGFLEVVLDRNIIHQNTQDGVQILGAGLGVDVDLLGNSIRFNGEDGVEIRTSANQLALVNIDDGAGTSIIADNLGRGVDILNRGDAARTSVTLNNTDVLRNRREGVYIVNTADGAQTQDSTSTALTANGAATNDPRMFLSINNNTIRENGADSAFQATGLVLQVGTSDASNSFTDNGGFASNGLFTGLGGMTRGGVAAQITGNDFGDPISGTGGNAGLDVLVRSFVSTLPPAQTTGAWTDQNTAVRDPANDVFDVDSFTSDPLARLDLNFTGNQGLAAQVTELGASYNNDESVFKSRTQGQDNGTDAPGPDGDDGGPFASGTRRRNAQRQAARDIGNAPPASLLNPQLTIAGTGGTGGTSDDFLYSGLGASTFRVTNTSSTANFALGDIFTLDNGPIFDQTSDAQGTPFPGANPGAINVSSGGELPFGWGLIP